MLAAVGLDPAAAFFCDEAPALLRQRDFARLRVGVLAVEERGVADGADAHAAALVRDPGAKRGAFVAVGAEEAQFHQLVRAQEFLQFGEKLRRETCATDLQAVFDMVNRGLRGWRG